MAFSRRRLAFRPSLETLAARIAPSGAVAMDIPLQMPVEPPSSDIPPPNAPTTSGGCTAPPLYPPDGTVGATPEDYTHAHDY